MSTQLRRTTLTPEAEARLLRYLNQVRVGLAGSRSVDADEVVRDVLDHVENELGEAPQPVSEQALAEVLGRLGSPMQWAVPEDMPWWRRAPMCLRWGPEDWQLAYLAFGLFALGLLLTPMPYVMVPLLMASWFLARAETTLVAEPHRLGARKWLVYPPLLAVYIPLVAYVLALPVVGAGALGWLLMEDYGAFGDIVAAAEATKDPWVIGTAFGIVACFAAAGATLWMLILRLVFGRWPSLLPALVAPFGRHIQTKWFTWLAIFAGVAGMLLGAATWWLWQSAVQTMPILTR